MQARRGGGLGEGMQGSGPEAFGSCSWGYHLYSEPCLRSTLSALAATFHCRWRENSKKRQLLLINEKLKLHSSASSQARPLGASVATQASQGRDDVRTPESDRGQGRMAARREGRHSVMLFPFLEEEEERQLTGESRAAHRGCGWYPSAPSESVHWRGGEHQWVRPQ